MKISLYIDFAFCFLFLPLMILVFPVERWWGAHPVFICSFVCWLYATYFIYKYVVVPWLFHGGRRRACAMAVVAASLLATYLFSTYEIVSPFYHLRRQYAAAVEHLSWGVRQNQQAVWIHYIMVVIFCAAVGMLDEAYRQRLAREEVEHERQQAELALYKAQINPHFLFNTLNTLYGLFLVHSDKAVATLERFINLMKYMYDNADRDFIPLSEEVEHIGEYIAIQKLRLNEFADVAFTHDVGDGGMPVPPMVLMTFVENAFKHGTSSCEPCFVRLSLLQQRDTLRFVAENSVFARRADCSKRMGVDNCRKRLALLYPGRYSLGSGVGADGVYRVELEIKAGGRL